MFGLILGAEYFVMVNASYTIQREYLHMRPFSRFPFIASPSPLLQAPREGSDTADPYVKLYLLPDPNKTTKKKTKINKKTLNPTYNETVSN